MRDSGIHCPGSAERLVLHKGGGLLGSGLFNLRNDVWRDCFSRGDGEDD